MSRSPVFLLDRGFEALPSGCGMQRGRAGTVPTVLVLVAVALAVFYLPAPASAQAPGPESFAQEPRTPAELWSAIDYLVRTGQDNKAVPYLENFVKTQTDDAALIEIRDRYGAGSFLRLADHPATSKYAQPLVERLTAAERRHATQPERIARAVAGLTGTPEEQAYAVARLKEAGPYAVPVLVEALQRPGISPEQRALADVILVDNEPLRSVINCGWTRGSGVLRCVGDSNTPHLFPTFCPKALGMKGRKLPDTTLSRCIVIGLKRKKPLEQPEHFRYVDDAGLSELRGRCMRWAADTAEALKVAAPEMPAGFDNRLGDNWRLMFAIADHAGGEWPEKARRAAANVSKVVGAADMSTGARLLADIRRIFVEKGVDRMPSADLADALGAMEDRPWSEWKGGKPITKNGLAKLLKPFDVFPGGIRVGGDTPRGYYLAQFQDAFERYLQAET